MKVEITKRYCDICKKEIQWHDDSRTNEIIVKVVFGNEKGHCRDSIYETKEVCDECMEGMGFTVLPNSWELNKEKNNLNGKFKNIIRKILNREPGGVKNK
ncbi:hypothetical protein M5L40_003595 [Clostridium botulinum]|nr:hypothetical protein [Clostridium botulinum]